MKNPDAKENAGETDTQMPSPSNDGYELVRTRTKVNPVAIVRPEYGYAEWDEDLGKIVVEVPKIVDHLLGLGFDSREVDILMKETSDPHLVAVMLLQKLGVDEAKKLQHKLPPMKQDLTLDDYVGEMVDQPKMLEMQRKYFFLQDWGGKVRVAWYDTSGAFRTRSVGDFKQAHMNEFIDLTVATDTGTKTVRKALSDTWLHSPKRRTYAEARFLPGQRPLPGLGIFNLWQGWPVKMASTGYPREMMHHLKYHMCGGDDAVFHWFMCWLADAVQNVHRTPTTAVVLAGPQGSGKDFFVSRFSEFFAPHALMITQDSQLIGNFNSHLMDKLLVHANEAFFAGNKKHANTLKSLVTDKTMVVEPKGVDAFQVPKHFRLIMASNEDRVVDLEIEDRRYLVLRVDAQELNNDREYFGQVAEAWENGEREMFFRELAFWPLDDWDEGAIPETEARIQQRELSLRGPVRDVMDLLDAGGGDAIKAHCPHTSCVAIKPRDGWTKAHGSLLRDVGAIRGQVFGVGRVWWLPPLNEAQRRFALRFRVRPDWEENLAHRYWDVPDGIPERSYPEE